MAHTKKVVLLGHFGVGKTSLIRQFVETEFSEDYMVTVGVHVKKKDVLIGDETVSLIIWDIEGNTSISKARASYLMGTHGFVYVFDLTRPETYESLEDEMSYLDTNFNGIPLALVGNKNDLIEKKSRDAMFGHEPYNNCYFTSAKTGENVEDMFLAIAEKMIS